MHRPTESTLESRLVEVAMRALFPCDLGDGIEVVHDVEVIQVEMDCDLDDLERSPLRDTLRFALYEPPSAELATVPYPRFGGATQI